MMIFFTGVEGYCFRDDRSNFLPVDLLIQGHVSIKKKLARCKELDF